ncbi:MAG: methionine--tRNA ligase [Cytophagales bacterium]
MQDPKRYTVTAALIYANGPIHIGHLAGCYLPADIYVRYLRSMGRDVAFVSGTDEHGVPITIKAKKENTTPQGVVDKYYKIIKESFEQFGISFDIYSRTSGENHHNESQEFFKKLYNENKFVVEETEQYYDETAQQFLADRYIIGTCPHCANENAYGDQCEKCGSTLNPTDLINPKSALSGAKPVMKKTKNWYLPLDKMQPQIEAFVKSHPEWKANVSGQCLSWLNQGLQPRAMTRDLDWGVKVPVPDADGKVLYVWFDAPIGYITFTKELCGAYPTQAGTPYQDASSRSSEFRVQSLESSQISNLKSQTSSWEDYWKSPDTKLVHFIGKDNIVFHCIIFPGMMQAEGSYIMPDNVPANEFMNLEGDKISTSRNWAVWLHEYLVDFPNKQDILRYVLCANAPETKDNDFTWKDFQTRNNSELVAIVGNFINRALQLTQKYYQGVTPVYNSRPEFEVIFNDIRSSKLNIQNCIENYQFRDALTEFVNIARIGNKFLQDAEPWKKVNEDPQFVSDVLRVALEITAQLAAFMHPFMPFSSNKLFAMLNLANISVKEALEKDILLTNNHQLGTPELLFEKIEDAQIAAQIAKLEASKAQNALANMSIKEAKPAVSFDDFTKMDIRIATILEAEKVPKTSKLLKLTVDTGLDKRTVVSGIAEYYKPEEVVGRQVCLLANLAPREIKGITSQGMILMAEDKDGKLSFVSPIDTKTAGSIVA